LTKENLIVKFSTRLSYSGKEMVKLVGKIEDLLHSSLHPDSPQLLNDSATLERLGKVLMQKLL